MNDAAEMFGVTRWTVLRWLKSGALRGYRTPGGSFRVDRESALAALQTPIRPDRKAEETEPVAAA